MGHIECCAHNHLFTGMPALCLPRTSCGSAHFVPSMRCLVRHAAKDNRRVARRGSQLGRQSVSQTAGGRGRGQGHVPRALDATTVFGFTNYNMVLGASCVVGLWALPMTVGMKILERREEQARKLLTEANVRHEQIAAGQWGQVRKLL